MWGASDTEVFAVGDAGIVFRWDGEAWHDASPNLGSKLFSVDRNTGTKILVGGAGGALWEGEADDWQQIVLPTQARLNGVLQHEQGGRWVCGAAGTLFHDDGNGWVPISLTAADLHSVCWFRGALCLAGGTQGIFRISDGKIENIKSTVTSYDLTTDGAYLVSSGDGIAIRYDGATWAGTKFG